MANWLIGTGLNIQDTLDSGTPQHLVADGGTFKTKDYVLPSSTRAVYVVLELYPTTVDVSWTLGALSTYTLEGVWIDGIPQGAVTSGSDISAKVLIILSYKAGVSTTVTEVVSFTTSGAAITVTVEMGELDVSGIAEEGITYRALDFERWYVCSVCGHQGSSSKMGLIDGKPYCFKFGDYLEELDSRRRKRDRTK